MLTNKTQLQNSITDTQYYSQKQKRVAIIFAGLHYAIKNCERHKADIYDVINDVDYRKYVKNIDTKLFNFFRKDDYEIDTYVSTNNSEMKENMIRTYQPKISIFDDKTTRVEKIIKILQAIYENVIFNKNGYNLICITRFDIYFMRELCGVKKDMFNIVSILEKDNLIDDNFYIFPFQYIGRFMSILQTICHDKKNRLVLHNIKTQLERVFNVNYICNENVGVLFLSFFKLRIFDNIQFIMNRYIFSDNVSYNSIGNTMVMTINNNTIRLNKLSETETRHAWIGYDIKRCGKYRLRFDILSKKNIGNYDFIKLHRPIKFYKIGNINSNILTHIDIIIETNENDELLCFIFDTYIGTLEIELSNIEIIEIVENTGIIINGDLSHNMESNCMRFDTIAEGTYEIRKNKTDGMKPYLWFGYDVTPLQCDMMISFDIKFIGCDIPNCDSKLSIKTHDPLEHHTNWLKKCKSGEFVTIIQPLYMRRRQLVIFIMDEFLLYTHFVIKNINISPISMPMKKMRLAVLVAGEMRNYDNKELMKMNEKNIFDKFEYDIFISTWDKRGSSPYHGTVSKKDYSNDRVEESGLRETYKNIKGIRIENFDKWLTEIPKTHKAIYDCGFFVQGSGKIIKCTVFPQLYKIWDANEMKKKYERDNGFTYDIVMRFRGDMCFVEEIPYAYLYELYNGVGCNEIWTINPPKIFYSNRIYDIFFYGGSVAMDQICGSWKHILELIEHKYENGLVKVDSCRVLYVSCLINNLMVINILRCIGDIYRDEPMFEYTNKILTVFN